MWRDIVHERIFHLLLDKLMDVFFAFLLINHFS